MDAITMRSGPGISAPACMVEEDGAPGGIRTPDQWLRKPLLYPAELQARGRLFSTIPAPDASIAFANATAPPILLRFRGELRTLRRPPAPVPALAPGAVLEADARGPADRLA